MSFHLNSSTASIAKGAEVIYPNSSWKPQVGADGKALATAIWDELGKLGLDKSSRKPFAEAPEWLLSCPGSNATTISESLLSTDAARILALGPSISLETSLSASEIPSCTSVSPF